MGGFNGPRTAIFDFVNLTFGGGVASLNPLTSQDNPPAVFLCVKNLQSFGKHGK